MLDKIDIELLKETANLHSIPEGAYNIRKNGESVGRTITENILIESNNDNSGLNIFVKPNTINQSVHIPVIVSKAGLKDAVRNDFIIGENSDVVIVAGCGIHNNTSKQTEHNGVHKFILKKNAKVKYIEKHIGLGKGENNIINPITEIVLEDGAIFEMETVQLSGVYYSDRKTFAQLGENSSLKVSEKVLTEGKSQAKTDFIVNLNGANSSTHIISRAVAKDNSIQFFNSTLNGNNKCFGHTECDAIIVGAGQCYAKPEVNAKHPESSLVHEAAIGKIAGEQIQKLLTLGLTEEEAQNQILKGFLK